MFQEEHGALFPALLPPPPGGRPARVEASNCNTLASFRVRSKSNAHYRILSAHTGMTGRRIHRSMQPIRCPMSYRTFARNMPFFGRTCGVRRSTCTFHTAIGCVHVAATSIHWLAENECHHFSMRDQEYCIILHAQLYDHDLVNPSSVVPLDRDSRPFREGLLL